jgi:hypothetical protein
MNFRESLFSSHIEIMVFNRTVLFGKKPKSSLFFPELRN